MKDNIKYLLSKDFFKPGIFGKVLFLGEIPISIWSAKAGYILSDGNPYITIGSVFIPQIATYLTSRTLELALCLSTPHYYKIFEEYKSISIISKTIDDKVKK
jgi:hypothetical protein